MDFGLWPIPSCKCSSRLKQKTLIQRLHCEVADRCQDFHHQESAKLEKRAALLLVTESLNIRGMTATAKGAVEAPGKNVKQKAGLNLQAGSCPNLHTRR